MQTFFWLIIDVRDFNFNWTTVQITNIIQFFLPVNKKYTSDILTRIQKSSVKITNQECSSKQSKQLQKLHNSNY